VGLGKRTRTVFLEQLFEVVQVEVVPFPDLARVGDEEADEEEDDDEREEEERVFEGAPRPRERRLRPVLLAIRIVLLVPKVRERHDQQAQHRVQRVQRVVHHLERVQDPIDLVRRGPVPPAALGRVVGRGHERDVDGQQQHRGQDGGRGENADGGHGGGAVAPGLEHEHEGGGEDEQGGEGGAVGGPDQAGLHGRHGVGLDVEERGGCRAGRGRRKKATSWPEAVSRAPFPFEAPPDVNISYASSDHRSCSVSILPMPTVFLISSLYRTSFLFLTCLCSWCLDISSNLFDRAVIYL
jgi:hypothetical protein